MSRSHSIIGLNSWAEKLLLNSKKYLYEEKIERRFRYPDGTSNSVLGVDWTPVYGYAYTQKFIGKQEDFDFGETPLRLYSFDDGRVYEEYIQAEPWASGPNTFLALKLNGEPVPESLWTEKEIQEQLYPSFYPEKK